MMFASRRRTAAFAGIPPARALGLAGAPALQVSGALALYVSGALALCLAGFPSPAAGYEGVAVTDGGRIAGRVTLAGTARPRPPLEVNNNQVACGRSVPDESLVVGPDGGLANAVVVLEGIERGKPLDPSRIAQLDNADCRFQPHVVGLTVGQVLQVRNSDPLLHNTHATAGEDETLFNLSLPIQGQVLLQRMKKPGIFRVRCDAGHGWMSAVLAVADHPYLAVTGSDGQFRIEDVPPGSYRLRTWHETVGEKTTPVEVAAGKEAQAAIAFSAPSAPPAPSAR